VKAHINPYVQVSFPEFVEMFPQLAQLYKQAVSDEVFNELMADDNYIVRVTNSHVEVGYKEDAWLVN